METVFVGIDPGKSGAVALLHPDNRVECFPLPIVKLRKKTSSKLKSGKNKGERKERTQTTVKYDLPGILQLFQTIESDSRQAGYQVRILLEDVHARPGNGIKQAFDFGYGRALLEMALVAASLDYELVIPGQWRVAMVGRGTDKAEAIMRARRMFPKAGLTAQAKSEGAAEALLMAAFLRIRDNGGSFARKLDKPGKKVKKVTECPPGAFTTPKPRPGRGMLDKAPKSSKAAKPRRNTPLRSPKAASPRPDQQDLQEAFDEMLANPAPIPIPDPKPRGAHRTLAERRAAWKARQGEKT